MKVRSFKVIAAVLSLLLVGTLVLVNSVTATSQSTLQAGTTVVPPKTNKFLNVSPGTAWWPVYYCNGKRCFVDNVDVLCHAGLQSSCAHSYDTIVSGKFKHKNVKRFIIRVIPTNDSIGVAVVKGCGKTVSSPYLGAPGKGSPGGKPSNLTGYTMIVNGKNCTTWSISASWKVYIKSVYVEYTNGTSTTDINL